MCAINNIVSDVKGLDLSSQKADALIVRARLMAVLRSDCDRRVFAEVWDACSDMDGYLQMHFSGDRQGKAKASRREAIFSKGWDESPLIFSSVFCDICRAEAANEVEWAAFESLVDIGADVPETESDGEACDDVKFESIVDFPHFLLHVLHVFNTRHNDNRAKLLVRTDAAKLLKEFDKVFHDCDDDDVKQFISCLAVCRYYFDKYMIKREFTDVKDEGSWSLKELKKSGRGKKAKPCYRNTTERWGGFKRHAELLRLETSLHVSHTKPKMMHWITDLLLWMYQQSAGGRLEGLLSEARAMLSIKEV